MSEQHEFDPGFTGLSTRCNRLVLDERGYGTDCGRLISDPVHFQRKAECIGCLTGHDIGLPSSEVAYAHPECPEHGEPEHTTAEEEEMLPEDPERAAWREFDRVDSMRMALDALTRREYEGTWPLASTECDYNPGESCHDVLTRGNGKCCRDYDKPRA